MLQPLQIKDVSVRYAEAIAEMRDFLSKAGVPTGRAASLGYVAARLQQDRTFRRDLTSYIWVVIEDTDRRITYSNLLGVLAIATAGTHFAADADDFGAHDLLRFLMEARRSLEEAPEVDDQSPVPAASTDGSPDRLASPVDVPRVPLNTPLRSGRVPAPIARPPQKARKSPVAWVVAAAFLLAALLAGVGLRSRSTSTAVDIPRGAAESSVEGSVAPTPNLESLGGAPDKVASLRHGRPVPLARQASHRAPSGSPAPISREAPSTLPTVAMDRITHDAPVTRAAPADLTPAPAPAAMVPAPRPTGTPNTSSGAIPSAVLSRRVGSRPIPLAYGDDSTADSSKYPRLLRRRPAATALSEDGSSLVAEKRPATASSFARSNVAVSRGVVRPISLGIMAANVLYSPAPEYPVAASAANVQGEVKVEAEVDRDGHVASARVVSGPPMLRDAAVDAVQHWRYRPFLAAGKPTSMNATAIVDFQLP